MFPRSHAAARSYASPSFMVDDADPSDTAEAPEALAVEVSVAWGSNPLSTEHLDPPRSFYVGSSEDECDFVLGDAISADAPLSIVLVEDQNIFVNAPIDADGEVTFAGSSPRSWRDLVGSGAAVRTVETPHLAKLALPFGAVARIEIAGVGFSLRIVQGGEKPLTAAFAPDTATLSYVGLSLIAHAGVFAAIAAFTPPLGLTESEDSFRDQMVLMSQYLDSAAERERLQEDDDSAAGKSTDASSGGTNHDPSPAPSSGGAPRVAPRPTAPLAGRGAPGSEAPTRTQLLQEAATTGMIALLNAQAPMSTAASNAWSGASMADTDDVSPVAWRGEIGDWTGTGWGLTGTGTIGDGPGSGPSIEGIGTLCQGDPSHCTGGPGGPGGTGSHGHLGRPHTPGGGPTLRVADTTINGHIPAEVIQRIVRQNYGRFRACYESGLRNNPQLQGRVAVRFVIGRDGSVTQAANGDSDMPDPSVVKCIVRSYYDLAFPSPEGGIVTVTYPIMFSNGG